MSCLHMKSREGPLTGHTWEDDVQCVDPLGVAHPAIPQLSRGIRLCLDLPCKQPTQLMSPTICQRSPVLLTQAEFFKFFYLDLQLVVQAKGLLWPYSTTWNDWHFLPVFRVVKVRREHFFFVPGVHVLVHMCVESVRLWSVSGDWESRGRPVASFLGQSFRCSRSRLRSFVYSGKLSRRWQRQYGPSLYLLSLYRLWMGNTASGCFCQTKCSVWDRLQRRDAHFLKLIKCVWCRAVVFKVEVRTGTKRGIKTSYTDCEDKVLTQMQMFSQLLTPTGMLLHVLFTSIAYSSGNYAKLILW